MPYIGRNLSVNYYKIIGRGGRPTHKTKPEVEYWMWELATKVKGFQPLDPTNVKIYLKGNFKDERAPDLSNLHKVIGDAIRNGLGIDDKHFKFVDLERTYWAVEPTLEIEVI